MNPRGKVALLNGGARMGKAVAAALARRGCHLALTYRSSRDAAEETAESARAAGVKAAVYRVDAREETQVSESVERTVRDLGGLHILINMASTYLKTPLPEVTTAAWSEALDSNARSALLFCLKAAPHMKKAGGGRIINFSDWLPVSGRPRYKDYVPYYAAKSALTGLTQGLALELAPEVLVNAVAPGPVVAPPDISPEEDAGVIAATPLRRWGGGEEIAKAVIFLIETDFVTGECLRVDGGRHLY